MFGRPKLHFTPRHGWINDPNGLIQTKEGFHLFAQHNPDDVVWGPMHWLHAVSDDMLHWRELGIALAPDALGTMFLAMGADDALKAVRTMPDVKAYFILADGTDGYEEYISPAMEAMIMQ